MSPPSTPSLVGPCADGDSCGPDRRRSLVPPQPVRLSVFPNVNKTLDRLQSSVGHFCPLVPTPYNGVRLTGFHRHNRVDTPVRHVSDTRPVLLPHVVPETPTSVPLESHLDPSSSPPGGGNSPPSTRCYRYRPDLPLTTGCSELALYSDRVRLPGLWGPGSSLQVAEEPQTTSQASGPSHGGDPPSERTE